MPRIATPALLLINALPFSFSRGECVPHRGDEVALRS